jgi:NDP-4-keto-2,6-dideoxyhexose 3-C-methyltransferase
MKEITKCRACGSEKLTEFLDLGKQYLSDFRRDKLRPPQYPLVAVLCEECKLVQLEHTTPQYQMYHDRYGFKSGISESIKQDLDSVVTHAFQYNNDPERWLDIASNDGTLLSFVPDNVYRVGVDPIEFLCKEAEQYADRIVNQFFNLIPFASEYEIDGSARYEKFDVITSISCFYDMPDPNQFVSDVVSLMDNHSVWIIQQNYLLTTMELRAVDNFCHEHLEYYTLLSLENLLEKHGLEVNEVYLSTINGGSIRTVVSYVGTFPVDDSVARQRDLEYQAGLDVITPYRQFAEDVGEELDNLHRLVKKLHDEGNKIVILAASTRGATIWQSADIGKEYISYAVERNPTKIGARFSAIDIPIVSEEQFRKDQPKYAIVGPWFYADEIMKRESEYTGHFIIPLPEVKIL